MGRPFTPIRRMRFATYFPLVACVILLHLRLVSLCQATVSECLTCATFSGQNGAFADACRNGDAAKIPKVGCKASSNYGCGVSVKKTWVGDQLTTTWTRSCCSEQACQDDVHTNEEGQEFDADSCQSDNCNTMDPSSGSSSCSGFNLLLPLLLSGSTTLSSLIA